MTGDIPSIAKRSLGPARGAEDAPISTAALRFVLDQARVAAQTRAVGQGRTIFLPAQASNHQLLAAVFASALPAPGDGQVDERFATETDTGVLWFDSKSPRIWQTSR